MKTIFKSPIGNLLVEESNHSIVRVDLTNLEVTSSEETPLLIKAREELLSYFEKETSFSFSIQPMATPFQLKVYEATRKIPVGKTASYGEIAVMIGNKNASRAVGQALNKNPIMIVIPCHRIIGKNNDLVGFYGGLDLKKRLLDHEKTVLSKDRIL
ncbi:methylated-DNA-[protein]-cysteine S-methyltransferase [Acholeplasma morum]|uniref:methylated-DNA--[protein]-cysteine S-methyltransferase n=1 Tax=Paracholeplasma morum TaxID=264637 RepID=UPI00195EC0B4|nr:methylated-DNA--[protein]-cysteine S-methyltransferase [Paracholeplasma morum]MBM7453642.1 methylated-DNA-[protein]-cysteine S-methyltransferase [Paracholeplasma morum]